jgi:hypothetical protein
MIPKTESGKGSVNGNERNAAMKKNELNAARQMIEIVHLTVNAAQARLQVMKSHVSEILSAIDTEILTAGWVLHSRHHLSRLRAHLLVATRIGSRIA